MMGIKVPVSAGIMPIVNSRQIERTVALSGASLPHDFTKMISLYENNPEKLPEEYSAREEEWGRKMIVTDYIAGLTDLYAVNLYQKLFIPSIWAGANR